MTGYTCSVCGQHHDELPMDLAYTYPPEFFGIPADQHAARVYFTADTCVIDGQIFLVRGVLYLPVRDSDQRFGFGTWARVSREEFKRYFQLWDADDAHLEPPFDGVLSGGIGYYEDSDGLPASVQLQSNNQRPTFVVTSDHPLGRDQREGITMHKVHAFLEHAGVLPLDGGDA